MAGLIVLATFRPAVFSELGEPGSTTGPVLVPTGGAAVTAPGPPVGGRGPPMTRAVRVEVLTADVAEAAQGRAAGALRPPAGPDRATGWPSACPPRPHCCCAVLGALRTGVVPVLLNATLQDAERDQLIDDADPCLAITDRDRLDELDVGSPVELAPYPLARPMHYTSGTTGRAKGVWSGVLGPGARRRPRSSDEADQWSFGPGDVHLVCSPMYHSVSIRFAGGTLLRGGSCIILERFDAEVATAVLLGRYAEAGRCRCRPPPSWPRRPCTA